MLTVESPEGIGEVTEGTDLAAVVLAALPDLADGDIVVVTSKVVSKAEGRVVRGGREEHLAAETRRVVARRGGTLIVQTHLGTVQAAAGIDASNVAPGSVVLLPRDPDASARALRSAFVGRAGVNAAVVLTDTMGRPWRLGQTDVAIGAAGISPLDDHAGRSDPYGNILAVTAPAVVDEIAGAADLSGGKLTGRPLAVVRGLGRLVLPAGEHGPGAAALVRPGQADLFALGAREAVLAALAGTDPECFGPPCGADDLVAALALVGITGEQVGTGRVRVPHEADPTLVRAVALAHSWLPEEPDRRILRPRTP